MGMFGSGGGSSSGKNSEISKNWMNRYKDGDPPPVMEATDSWRKLNPMIQAWKAAQKPPAKPGTTATGKTTVLGG